MSPFFANSFVMTSFFPLVMITTARYYFLFLLLIRTFLDVILLAGIVKSLWTVSAKSNESDHDPLLSLSNDDGNESSIFFFSFYPKMDGDELLSRRSLFNNKTRRKKYVFIRYAEARLLCYFAPFFFCVSFASFNFSSSSSRVLCFRRQVGVLANQAATLNCDIGFRVEILDLLPTWII